MMAIMATYAADFILLSECRGSKIRFQSLISGEVTARLAPFHVNGSPQVPPNTNRTQSFTHAMRCEARDDP